MARSRNSRGQYMRDRAERKRYQDYGYQMDHRHDRRESRGRYDTRMDRDRYYPEEYYMDYKQSRESGRVRNSDLRRDREYDSRSDYADDDYEKEYHEDLKEWIEGLKKFDKFALLKDQVLKKASEMGVRFEEYEPEEFYAIYLMHVSDYPTIANDPHTYLAMTKSWLEDKDINIEPSEKVCRYMYEIAMADED